MHPHFRNVLIAVALFSIAGAWGGIWALSRGPDFELRFEREVRSALPAHELQQALETVERWPEWHFNAIRAERARSEQNSGAGPEQVRLFLEPPKKEWKRFELDLGVASRSAGRLEIRLERESKGRLRKLLRDIGWTIELLPAPDGQGTLIRGQARAWTAGARGRILGRITPRIVMNQVFYPDLEALAQPEKRRGHSGEAHHGRLLPF